MSYDEDPDETIYFKENKQCGILCEVNIPFLLLNGLANGFIAEGRIKKPVFSLPEWTGGYSQKIKIWPTNLHKEHIE